MSYSRIGQIVLYIIIIITIPIMLLFFVGSSMVNTEEYDAKVEKIENPSGAKTGMMQDLQSADSLALSPSVRSTSSAAPKLSFMEKLVYFKTDVPLVWGYILLIVGIVITIVFPIAYAIKHPANLLRTLLLLVGIAVLVFAAYFIASGKPIQIPGYNGTANSDYKVLKFIDTGLIFSYFLLFLAMFSILYAEVRNYFR